ncbi:lysylphosphatidylglycerol synthase transmembrane domain-containing protein [Dyadobacter psychrotolerans]|uniref:Flippase-like domain-containing protein n=1 Tax=Dyadobacter psychrotolerans TaxID=2541721 RepID=A0A4R5DMY0_9BACT|nr:lysylphosphatidylglycerol synthase transmembrane domain-containing protein [Dyadobacter psychrotolerans]TDE15666.1 flippase-like domain-containing protein [Dyadobacter psychrotolerans]
MKIFKVTAIITIILSFCLFVKATDMQQVTLSLSKIGYQFIYLLLITLAAYWSATIGWKYTLGKKAEKISVTYLFLIRHIGEMVSLVNPASVVAGEAVKVYLLQDTPVKKAEMISSVLISRIMIAITQLLLFFLTLAYVFLTDYDFFERLPMATLLVFAWLIVLLVIVVIFSRSTYIREIFARSKLSLKIQKLADIYKLRQVFIEFNHFFKTNKKGLLLCTLFFSLHWVIGSLEIYAILKFLGIKTGILQVLFVDMGIILFKSAGAFIPGQIGVEEIGNKVMLELVGIQDAGVWITVSVLRRSRQVFWLICGMVFYFLYDMKRKGLSKFFNGDSVHKS